MTAADAPAAAAMLARAFYDDPVMTWSFPDDRRRLRGGERFFELRARTLLAHGRCFVAGRVEAAALWAPPGEWRVPPGELARLMPAVASPRLPLVALGLGRVQRLHPRTPEHEYLAVLGADPQSQGRGLGSAVLAPVLEDCDVHGVPAYLETGKERNVAFYARHGFRVTEQLDLPRGPRVWLMWRDPRT